MEDHQFDPSASKLILEPVFKLREGLAADGD